MSRTGAEMRQTAKTAQYLVLPLLRVLQVATDSVVRRLCARALSFLAMRGAHAVARPRSARGGLLMERVWPPCPRSRLPAVHYRR